MSRRPSPLHMDPSSQQGTSPPSSPSVHRIVIEARHYDSVNSSATAINAQSEPSSPRDSQYNDRRLSLAAMALIDELDLGSALSRRSSVSHHIIIETHDQQQAIASGSNRSSMVGSPYYFNESSTTLYAPRTDHGRYSSGYYHGINNRSSMPAATLVEEDEYDITSPPNKCHHEIHVNDDVEGHDPAPSESPIDTPVFTPAASEKDGKMDRLRNLLDAGKKTAKSLFIKYWFLLGLGLVIGLAWAFPDVGKANGTLQAQYTIKWGAVIVIFLLSGLGIDVRVMFKTILQWKMHLVVQLINFIALPFLMYGIVLIFIAANARIDSAVYKGWMIALSTSTTVSSNVVMTRNAKGNDSGALFNAAFGNVLGIFMCPALMSVFQQDPRVFPPGTPHGNPNYINVLRNLGFTVLLPLVIGQVIRFMFSAPVKKLAAKLRFPIINNLALLTLVWSVFCDGVASNAFHQMTAVDIVTIIFVDIFMYLFGCALCLFVARVPWPSRFAAEPQWISRWRFDRKDTVAIMYCGATKTVSMGIPLINVLYAESSYGVVGVLSLPLLLYHIIQLFIGNFQVQLLKSWISRNEKKEAANMMDENEKHQVSTDQNEGGLPSSSGTPKHSLPNGHHELGHYNSRICFSSSGDDHQNEATGPIPVTYTTPVVPSPIIFPFPVDNLSSLPAQATPIAKPNHHTWEDAKQNAHEAAPIPVIRTVPSFESARSQLTDLDEGRASTSTITGPPPPNVK